MRFGLRNLSTALGILGMAAGIAWTIAVASADAPAAPKDAAERKSDHVTVAALRNRLMTEYHGRASEVFTSVPGFGMMRMIPVYERIPWEVPHFSTNDVEVEKSPATPKLLNDVFAKSLESFEKPETLKIAPKGPDPRRTPFIAPKYGFGREVDGVIAHGVQLRLLDLVGNLDPARPKVYSGGKAFELVRGKRLGGLADKLSGKADTKADAKETKKDANAHFPDMEQRPLDLFESAGLIELSDGKETFIRAKDNVIRMMGALRAGDQCLKCHTESRKGDLLGAFSYTFLDTSGSLKLGASKEQP